MSSSACALPVAVESFTPTATITSTATSTKTPIPTATATVTNTPTNTRTPFPTLTPQPTWPPGVTPSLTPSPTIEWPTGVVLQQANCRYGPGGAYLYELGLFEGYRVVIYGRNDLGTWVYIRPRYYEDRCWVRADLLDISGDIYNVPPVYNRLPQSDLYQPPTTVSAERRGNEVIIAWSPVWMTEDDYRGYLLELWLCVDGQIVFTPVHSDETIVTVVDEPGCMVPSSGRVYTAEKHGYTQWRLIPWPPAPTPEATPTLPYVE
jgi:hypothetical protein